MEHICGERSQLGQGLPLKRRDGVLPAEKRLVEKAAAEVHCVLVRLVLGKVAIVPQHALPEAVERGLGGCLLVLVFVVAGSE